MPIAKEPDTEYNFCNRVSEAPTIYSDHLMFASDNAYIITLHFIESSVDIDEEGRKGPVEKFVLNLNMPIAKLEDTIKYLQNVLEKAKEKGRIVSEIEPSQAEGD